VVGQEQEGEQVHVVKCCREAAGILEVAVNTVAVEDAAAVEDTVDSAAVVDRAADIAAVVSVVVQPGPSCQCNHPLIGFVVVDVPDVDLDPDIHSPGNLLL